MASVVREARVAAPAARCWDALRAFDAPIVATLEG